MNQHFVDDELEEDRRHQRERLDEQRGDGDLGERLAVSRERGQKPAEAESCGIGAGAGEPARDQDDLARCQRFGLVDGHVHGVAGDRLDQADPSLDGRGDDEGEPSGLEADNGRIRNDVEPLGARSAEDARFQLQQIRAAHEVFGGGGAAAQRELMAQLRGIGGDAVVACDHREGGQTGIRGRGRAAAERRVGARPLGGRLGRGLGAASVCCGR